MSDPGRLHLVDELGVVENDGEAWLRAASLEDRGVLARAVGPVLDVGCGPGRHVRALQGLGIEVLGIDVTPSMVETASSRGARVLGASIFDPLPQMGEWLTALLLDGNSGLGGDPVTLLRRLRAVLHPDGRVLADLWSGPPVDSRRLRLRHGRRLGPHFGWAPLRLDELRVVTERADVEVVDVWEGEHRWFCELRLLPSAPEPQVGDGDPSASVPGPPAGSTDAGPLPADGAQRRA